MQGKGEGSEKKKGSDSKSVSKALTFYPAKRLRGFLEPTVWHHFTPLARETKAVNLGQGFPGWSPPNFVQKAMSDAVQEHGGDFMLNQYARSAGHMPLVQRLVERYSKRFGRKIDAENEVFISQGATEGLYCICSGLIEEGDEVVMFEPAFDIYQAQVEMCGGTAKNVPLTVVEKNGKFEWVFDLEELKKAFTSKTRMFLLNTPHNPTGKVFTRAELTAISKIIQSYPDVVCVADEVYEHLVYDGKEHLCIATLPGMWERTITLSSAGKTFSVTGWKIGWCIGPSHLIRPLGISHQWVCFSINTPAQEAIARALDFADKPYQGKKNYYEWLAGEYLRKREILARGLRNAGITPIIPEGSFFICGDTRKLKVPDKWLKDTTEPYDWRLCRWLCVDIGVAAIPPSSFYCEQNKSMAKNLARFAFCKPDDVIEEAGKRLAKLKDHWITAKM